MIGLFDKKSNLDAEIVKKEYSAFLARVDESLAAIKSKVEAFIEDPDGTISVKRQRVFLNGILELLKGSLYYDCILTRYIEKERVGDEHFYPFSTTELPRNDVGNVELMNKWIFGDFVKDNSLAELLERIDNNLWIEAGRVYYLKRLGIGFVASDGNHRLIATKIANVPYVGRMVEIDDTEYIDTLFTDGYEWFKDNEPIAKVIDYRIALIFTIVKLYNL